MSTVDLSQLSTEELEKHLAERKADEKAQRQAERTEYEAKRDLAINKVIGMAKDTSIGLRQFKESLHKMFNEHEEALKNYGGIRGNSKGGFSLISKDGKFKATRIRSTQPSWDERSQKAIELIADFLRDTVKKKDLKLYDILSTFIQKNDKGDLEYAKVMHLLSHKDKYDDPRWVEGLELLQESYSIHLRAYQYEFSEKDEQGKWKKIEINFTSL